MNEVFTAIIEANDEYQKVAGSSVEAIYISKGQFDELIREFEALQGKEETLSKALHYMLHCHREPHDAECVEAMNLAIKALEGKD